MADAEEKRLACVRDQAGRCSLVCAVFHSALSLLLLDPLRVLIVRFAIEVGSAECLVGCEWGRCGGEAACVRDQAVHDTLINLVSAVSDPELQPLTPQAQPPTPKP